MRHTRRTSIPFPLRESVPPFVKMTAALRPTIGLSSVQKLRIAGSPFYLPFIYLLIRTDTSYRLGVFNVPDFV